jgi:hypothetical protein
VSSRILFAGPSLPDAAELARGRPVTVLPPVAAGDLLRLPLSPGDVVGIADGYFSQVGAVRHKEILELLCRGVRVLGAASMGALRAAELDSFGMEGIGGIYADYRDALLVADDEVALLHGTAAEGYRPLSVPLVCIRATLSQAVRDGACDTRTAQMLVDTLARWPFGLRSYHGLEAAGREAGLDASRVRTVHRYCADHCVDPKREDALLLLGALLSADPAAPPRERPAVHRTSFLYAWQTAALGMGQAGDPRTADLGTLRACQLFADDYPGFYRGLILRAIAEQCGQECADGAPQAGRQDVQEAALRHGEHRGFYRLVAQLRRPGFVSPWLTRAERRTLTARDQLTTFLVRGFRVAPALMWDELAIGALRDTPVWTEARNLVRLAWDVNDHIRGEDHSLDLGRLSEDRILDFFAQRWAAEPGELELAAMDRGLDSTASLLAAGRAFYLLARYNPGIAALTMGLDTALDPDRMGWDTALDPDRAAEANHPPSARG